MIRIVRVIFSYCNLDSKRRQWAYILILFFRLLYITNILRLLAGAARFGILVELYFIIILQSSF
jgi:hypothetical protein